MNYIMLLCHNKTIGTSWSIAKHEILYEDIIDVLKQFKQYVASVPSFFLKISPTKLHYLEGIIYQSLVLELLNP